MKYLKQKETIVAIGFAIMMLIIDQLSKIFASNILPFRQCTNYSRSFYILLIQQMKELLVYFYQEQVGYLF